MAVSAPELQPVERVWILVLEEEPQAGAMLGEVLQTTGAEVVVCMDVDEAKSAIEARDRPAVVVLNLALSELPGTDFVAQLRSKTGFEYVPAIYLADVEPPLTEEIADPVLRKPPDVDRLMGLVAGYCAAQQR